MPNHPSFFRLQRPSLIVKGAFWSFLTGLFFIQQVTTAIATHPSHAANPTNFFALNLPAGLVLEIVVLAALVIAAVLFVGVTSFRFLRSAHRVENA